MLDRPLNPPDSVPADHSDASIRRRANLSIGREVHWTWTEVELTGAPLCGATFKVEVEFVQTHKGAAPSWEDPGSADEFEIVSVRPFEHRMLETGFMGTERHLLPCPNWLAELLIGCVDADSLKADHC